MQYCSIEKIEIEQDSITYLAAIVSDLGLECAWPWKTHDDDPVLADVCQINVESIFGVPLAGSAHESTKHLYCLLIDMWDCYQ